MVATTTCGRSGCGAVNACLQGGVIAAVRPHRGPALDG